MQGAEKLSETPKPSEFIWTQTFKLSADRLEFAIRSKSRIVLMLGQSGTGKTSLIHEILDTRLGDFSVAYVGDPAILDAELKQTLRGALAEMRRTAPDDGGQAPVFIVDDAHKLLQTTLARLVEYTNQDTSEGPALKLVLVANPDFEAIFHRLLPGIAGPTFTLSPLPIDEAKTFVRDKLVALGEAHDLLRDDEVDRLVERSKAIPARLTRSIEASIERKSARESAFGLDAAINPRPKPHEAGASKTARPPLPEPHTSGSVHKTTRPGKRGRHTKVLLVSAYLIILFSIAAVLYFALGMPGRAPFAF